MNTFLRLVCAIGTGVLTCASHAANLYVNVVGATNVGLVATHPMTDFCTRPCGIVVGQNSTLDLTPTATSPGSNQTYVISTGGNWYVSLRAPMASGNRMFSHWSGCDALPAAGQCQVSTSTDFKQVTAVYFVSLASGASGTPVPEMASYDVEIQKFMTKWGVPGASVAVAREGRLVFARGYGVADTATGAPVQPDSQFRIASLSKPITAAAVMRLVQEGRLSLYQKVFPYLDRGAPADTRLNDITVWQLLQHAAGWDSDIAGDPMFNSQRIAADMNVASPPDADTIVRWMLTRPLQYTPGYRYAYSNFGYLVLGQMIEKASGQSYQSYVTSMLREAGITRMKPGASLATGRLPYEVAYSMESGASYLVPSVFSSSPASVPWPYGGFAIEPMVAHGGWVGSAVDLVAFATAMDGNSQRPDLLTESSLRNIASKPAYSAIGASNWYGKGWQVNAAGNLWHTGSLPGTASLLVRAANGTAWAVLLNLRSESQTNAFFSELDNLMWVAFAGVRQWPSGDQFPAWLGAEQDPAENAGALTATTKYTNYNRSRLGMNLSLATTYAEPKKVFVWAALNSIGDFCYSPGNGWTFAQNMPNSTGIGRIADETAQCTGEAFTVTSSSQIIDYPFLSNIDLSDSIFDGIKIYAALGEASNSGLIDVSSIQTVFDKYTYCQSDECLFSQNQVTSRAVTIRDK